MAPCGDGAIPKTTTSMCLSQLTARGQWILTFAITFTGAFGVAYAMGRRAA